MTDSLQPQAVPTLVYVAVVISDNEVINKSIALCRTLSSMNNERTRECSLSDRQTLDAGWQKRHVRNTSLDCVDRCISCAGITQHQRAGKILTEPGTSR